jgi:hypothetical protein
MKFRLAHLRFAAAALAFAAVSLAGPAAFAFSMDSQSSGSSGGNARFADPDDQIQNLFGGGGSQSGQSGSSVQFGVQRPGDPAQVGPGGLFQPSGPRPFGKGNND